jgi:hypothetical protein
MTDAELAAVLNIPEEAVEARRHGSIGRAQVSHVSQQKVSHD